MRVLSIGEVLWDHCGTVSTLGGAPLNFSAHMALLGHQAAILSAVGCDEWGERALRQIEQLGIDCRFLQKTGYAPTGSAEITSTGAEEQASAILRPAAYEATRCSSSTLKSIAEFHPDWLYVGTLFHLPRRLRQQLSRLRKDVPDAKVFYDVNLRAGNWSPEVVEELAACADIIKVNEAEARELAHLAGVRPDDPQWLESFATAWQERFAFECLCVTRGAEGCVVFTEQRSHAVTCAAKIAVDSLGAGDAFCAGFLHGWEAGWLVRESACAGNLLGGMVTCRRGAIPDWTEEERREVQRLLVRS